MTEPHNQDREYGRGDHDETERGGDDRDRVSAPAAILKTLRSDVRLWIPFFLVGCLWTVLDRIRLQDSLPTTRTSSESVLQVTYTPYPTGSPETVRTLDALVNLPADVFAYAIAIEVVAVSAVMAGGWVTMRKVSDDPFSTRGSLAYCAGVAVLFLLSRLGTAVPLVYSPESFLFGIVALAVGALAAVRTFFLPIAILRGPGVLVALRTSWRRSVSHGFSLIGLIIVIGLGSSWLAELPTVGVLLSASIVGPIHSVALVILYERFGNRTYGNAAGTERN
ncbi:hypothetical protein SAMN05192561_11826 [Halopenitus malekzadehii]|uniref:Uncharacterized protein n=1 Tax=Halopenitus malekzadehii TaxID=1267564 RepID=A0A1H6JTF5_9EURY|nr:hypothetical protein [Halopenitus malekzadehii]SEH64261.1 hypothetical protein SAMN05192561_11826 [Halopenitus malekzadehii]